MSSGKKRTYSEFEIKFKLAGLNTENVSNHYSRRYKNFLFFKSDEVILNGTIRIPKSERIGYMMGENRTGDNDEVFCNEIRDGFPINEKEFIFDERVIFEDFKTQKFKLRKQIELYTNYLDRREREISEFGESEYNYPPIGETPFQITEHYEIFQQLNDSFNVQSKIRWTHIYNFLKDEKKIVISQSKYFGFINSHFENVATRVQATANSEAHFPIMNQILAL